MIPNGLREIVLRMEESPRIGWDTPSPCFWKRCDSKGVRREGSAKDMILKGISEVEQGTSRTQDEGGMRETEELERARKRTMMDGSIE